MSVITTGNSPRLLQEGVKRVFGQAYNGHSAQHTSLFDQETSRKELERLLTVNKKAIIQNTQILLIHLVL